VPEQAGTVFWITGLAGAGKTAIALELINILKRNRRRTVLLDGDELREVLDETNDYSISKRRQLAFTYGRLAKLISAQGSDVVCATISMFHACRSQNRKVIEHYFEVYLDVPLSVLKKRDKKKLYGALYSEGEGSVVLPGHDLEIPQAPDITIVNDGNSTPRQLAEEIFSHWQDQGNI